MPSAFPRSDLAFERIVRIATKDWKMRLVVRVWFSGAGRNGITIVDTTNETIVATCQNAHEASEWLRYNNLSWIPGSRGLWGRK
jgi:hypothetical protein